MVDFRNYEAYRKWLAYGHIHGVFKGRKQVTIAGEPHHVTHKRN
jgi:hypothetical protein